MRTTRTQPAPAPVPKKRCAVYTRKSTDEGLEQEYNSLEAQRDAGLANVASQRHEGWVALDDGYDDGGYSRGNLERPALKRLLADIEARCIDIVVAYKIDRLTRSLPDFAKPVEVLDRAGVSFVSVTQQFNTTTSMGRPIDQHRIFAILRNRVYLGDMVHKGKHYPGQHEPIVPQALWDAAHAIIERRKQGPRERRAKHPALLASLLYAPRRTAHDPPLHPEEKRAPLPLLRALSAQTPRGGGVAASGLRRAGHAPRRRDRDRGPGADPHGAAGPGGPGRDLARVPATSGWRGPGRGAGGGRHAAHRGDLGAALPGGAAAHRASPVRAGSAAYPGTGLPLARRQLARAGRGSLRLHHAELLEELESIVRTESLEA